MPAKVIHGHSIEIELGPSCPNPGIRRELEAPVKYEDIWNNSDEEPEDYEWIPETEIEDVYGIDFMESLPNIDDGEMVEIRIKCTAEKCE